MERLTERIDGVVVSKERYSKYSPCHHCKWQSTDKCLEDGCTYGGALNQLAAYEYTGLTPEEIIAHEEIFNAYRHVCGGKSPEEIRELQQERDCWKNEAVSDKSKLGLLRLWFGSKGMDMDDILTEISEQVK